MKLKINLVRILFFKAILISCFIGTVAFASPGNDKFAHYFSANVRINLFTDIDFDTFVDLVMDKNVDRFILPSLRENSDDTPVWDATGSSIEKTVYYLWGYLEKEWVNQEYQEAYKAIKKFRNAGYKVVVDGWVTRAEAKSYFASRNNIATYWSSHGNRSGDLTVQVDSSHYGYFKASDISKNGGNLGFVLLCSCWSKRNSSAFAAALDTAVWGYSGTVKVSTCTDESHSGMIELFNKYF